MQDKLKDIVMTIDMETVRLLMSSAAARESLAYISIHKIPMKQLHAIWSISASIYALTKSNQIQRSQIRIHTKIRNIINRISKNTNSTELNKMKQNHQPKGQELKTRHFFLALYF